MTDEAAGRAPGARRGQTHRAVIGVRPAGDPAAAWVHRDDAPGGSAGDVTKASPHTARLTLDVTPALRGRIKVMAFRRGLTAADMLRELLEREYPEGTS